MLEICHWLLGLLTLTTAAAPLLHRHHLLVSLEVHIQNAHKLPAVHQVSQCLALASKEARKEADTGVVLIHFVLIAPDGHLFLEEGHHVK